MQTKVKVNTAIALTALAVAVLGATPLGQAATTFVVPGNSVGSAQLKANSVTGAKVKNGTLTAAKFKAGQLPSGPAGPQGAKGDPGAAGAQGPKGDKGDPGTPGVSGYAMVVGPAATLGPSAFGGAVASCPTGKKALGGGFNTSKGVFVSYNGVDNSHTAWIAQGENSIAATGWIQAFVICGTVA